MVSKKSGEFIEQLNDSQLLNQISEQSS